jgi:transaldolase
MTAETAMTSVANLSVKIFADGADLAGMVEMYRLPWIKGFTTNPTLMRKAGVRDYRAFARDVVRAIPDRPISFEVFSDDFAEMEGQALEIASWAPNVNVKIPVTNTRGDFAGPLVRRLSLAGVPLNITAVMTFDQVSAVVDALAGDANAFVSLFAGRIADTGRDPLPIVADSAARVKTRSKTELVWASPRELLNIFQAEAAGCDIITVSNDILKKLDLVGKDLTAFSLETVAMFRDDAVKAGYAIGVAGTPMSSDRSVGALKNGARKWM